MDRYHIKTGFNLAHISLLKELNNKLNCLEWKYTNHCIDNLKDRAINIKDVLYFIKNLSLKENNIFEYYAIKNKIIKACYRVNYNKYNDIILVLDEDKRIITIYLNSSNDNHVTLKKYLYNKP